MSSSQNLYFAVKSKWSSFQLYVAKQQARYIWLTHLNRSVNCWNIYIYFPFLQSQNNANECVILKVFLYRRCRQNIRLYNTVWRNTSQQHHTVSHWNCMFQNNKAVHQQLSTIVSPTAERYHLHDGVNLYTQAETLMCSYDVQLPRMKHIFTFPLLYTLHFPLPITSEVPPPTPPTCIHTPISIATPHGSINTGCELFSDELLINNKQWGSGET